MPVTADPEVAAAYVAAGWWGQDTPTDLIRRNAAEQPDDTAYVTWSRPTSEAGDVLGSIDRTTWAGYDWLSDRVAAALLAAGLDRGDRAAVILPDSAAVHAAFTGADKAGVVVMGIGHRAGPAEIAHLFEKSGARAIITGPAHRGRPAAESVAELRQNLPALAHHITVDGLGQDATLFLNDEPAPAPESVLDFAEAVETRRLGASELCLLNSTSGTTGLPKCVMQTHNRWFYFHQKAVEYSGLGADEVFCVPVPAPFGFGLWTAHYTPTILGVPTVVMADFDAAALLRLIEAERVTVLCAVTTQFIMMLNSPAFDDHDLSSLRLMFTGGEAIPYQRAAEFEDRTGCTVLNFYGSNETGMLSGTRLSDPRSARLRTGGKCEPEMDCALYDPDDGQRLPEGPRPARLPGTGPRLGLLRRRQGQHRSDDRRRPDADGRHRGDRRRRLPASGRTHVGLHHPGRQEHQRPRGGGRGDDPSSSGHSGRSSRPRSGVR